ncbi:signal transduction histidine kinase [Breznakibacter xylanolyticus]|uniref:histidine kinase n=2 Tax=Breznakibacter xylanolyticus TaxID=990 RepID=A0A2W7N7X0_9BACT|nr:signal transduction histidine kinase [Breznakibacter xylanolyticus]
MILLVIGSIGLVFYVRMRGARRREILLRETVRSRTADLLEANEELKVKSEQIVSQNQELELHRQNLEQLVQQRTHDLELAKERAEQSDSLKSAFLANMSHEIRTPLNAILGFSSLLVADAVSKEEMPGVAGIIQNNGEALLQLINDILDVSLIEANQIELNRTAFSIFELLTQLQSELTVLLHAHDRSNVAVLIDFDSQVGHGFSMVADSRRVRQVFLNLMGNAVKFTSSGRITLGFRVNQQAQNVLFFVKDTGVGIDPENVDVIFDRFRKIEFNQSEVHRGTGLGLSISKNLVELMGGKIWVESERDVGSVFYFELPLEQSPDEALIESSREQKDLTDGCWHDQVVLVAEDEESNFLVIQALLKSTQITIEWVANGQLAVERVVANPLRYGLVLMDVKLPVMNGNDATRLIKKECHIPVVAQTAFATAGEINEFMKYGYDDYVLKPLDFKSLTGVMKKFLT